MHCQLVYSAADEPMPVKTALIVGALGVGFLLLFLLSKKRTLVGRAILGFGAAFAFSAGGLGVSNVWHQRSELRQRVLAGDFETVEGQVEGFTPLPSHGHGSESFTVKGIRFKYAYGDSSRGGYRGALYGSPIREGLYVRIGYWDSRIVRLETCQSGPAADSTHEPVRGRTPSGAPSGRLDP
jgi:hypothetical protein